MGPWLTRSEDGRWQIDCHRLSLPMRLAIAIAVVTAVVAVARIVEPAPPWPDWLAGAIRAGAWIYLGLVAFLLGRWLLRRTLSIGRPDRERSP
jgi:hypothetical protein